MSRRKHNAESFSQAAVEYFEDCVASDRTFTLAGLAAGVGVCMQTLSKWKRQTDDEDLSEAVGWAYLKVQAYHEEMLFTARNPTPHIYYLKSAFGMHDTPSKTQVEVTGKDGQPFGVVVLPMITRDVSEWQAMVEAEDVPATALPDKT